ncbi:hypothetical protein B0A52_06910 [Exophiala mesophila]|uniref:polynucleotide adenylyltransferase n=1 Tax=Exophiala mesophila TaxID=212818 RepID=A0A438N0U7_EXOME|nr:hypothetical protein B0A52_06910 [Exophiala mesophila]
MPSTPYQRPQSHLDLRNSPSPDPNAKVGSPRSQPSEKDHTPPGIRKPHGSCRFETGMARARRRVPYSLGPEPLEPGKGDLKARLTQEEDQKLTADIQSLYKTLQPSAESEERRASFVQKLRSILQKRWPQSSTNVNVFGSTGNHLGTSDSDVDICITTDCTEMERVCSIAELLAKNGMERVVCVSSAKVPIVKVWDPELQVACDINVNNPLALENTDLVRTYVELDSRVRPLAMLIKHWAKRRLLNDAALGGTLSSYTWICLALNFLQTRIPPILPSLQQQKHLEPKILAGVDVAFDHNTDTYKGFGSKNESSLGELFFQFFRYYGHELDFEHSVVSVRMGRLLPKVEKSWHLTLDNRLCVEEPFNISRNLANTADDTSMRGIHLELRRAFDLLSQGQLDQCCEQFEHPQPQEDLKPSDIFVPPSSRPVITQQPTQPLRAPRNSGRGRHSSHANRNVSGRRSSNPSGRNSAYLRNLPFQMTTQELQLQAQHQQHLLHDQLFQQYQYLQLQEQELRMQLHQQNLRHRGLIAAGYPHVGGYQPLSSHEDHQDANTNSQAGGVGRAPMSAPLYQQRFMPVSPYLQNSQTSQGTATDPPSPRMQSGFPDTRRFSRRTSLTQASTGGSLRAQSQPARVMPAPIFNHPQARSDLYRYQDPNLGRRSSSSSTSHDPYGSGIDSQYGGVGANYDSSRRPAEYLGYYVGHSPSLSAYTQSTTISPIPSHVGLAIQNGGLSPRMGSVSARSTSATDFSPLQQASTAVSEANRSSDTSSDATSKAPADPVPAVSRNGPLIVDGSVHSPRRRRTAQVAHDSDEHMNFSASTSEDLAFDTPSSSDEQSQDAFDMKRKEKSTAASPRPNGGLMHSGLMKSDFSNGHVATHRVYESSTSDSASTKPSTLTERSSPISSMDFSQSVPWPLDRQLSAVEEVRTPSPRGAVFPKQGTSSKGLVQSESSLVNGSGTEGNHDRPLALRANGTLTGTPPSATSGGSTVSAWQTAKKKKHRNRKDTTSETDGQNIKVGAGEALPADDSQRKGG